MGALVVALVVIVFCAAVLSSRLAKRLAPYVATTAVAAIVQAGTGDWSLTIATAGGLLVAAAFVATTRELVSILRTSS